MSLSGKKKHKFCGVPTTGLMFTFEKAHSSLCFTWTSIKDFCISSMTLVISCCSGSPTVSIPPLFNGRLVWQLPHWRSITSVGSGFLILLLSSWKLERNVSDETFALRHSILAGVVYSNCCLKLNKHCQHVPYITAFACEGQMYNCSRSIISDGTI